MIPAQQANESFSFILLERSHEHLADFPPSFHRCLLSLDYDFNVQSIRPITFPGQDNATACVDQFALCVSPAG